MYMVQLQNIWATLNCTIELIYNINVHGTVTNILAMINCTVELIFNLNVHGTVTKYIKTKLIVQLNWFTISTYNSM